MQNYTYSTTMNENGQQTLFLTENNYLWNTIVI